MKTVFLTGATGFLGSYLLDALVSNKYRVVVLKRSSSNLWRIQSFIKNENVYFHDIDLEPIESVFKQYESIHAVIHTACHYGRNKDVSSIIIETNLVFSLRLLDAAIHSKVLLFINTDTFLEKNLNDYSLSKKQFVEWLKQKRGQIKVANLKLEHMYGPKDDNTKFIGWLISQLKIEGSEIPLTIGTQLRDFIYIDDVVSAYLTVLEKESELQKYAEFEVGTGVSIAVKSFIQAIKAMYEQVYGNTNVFLDFGSVAYRKNETMLFKVDNTALKRLGWQPLVSMKKGILKTVEDLA